MVVLLFVVVVVDVVYLVVVVLIVVVVVVVILVVVNFVVVVYVDLFPNSLCCFFAIDCLTISILIKLSDFNSISLLIYCTILLYDTCHILLNHPK